MTGDDIQKAAAAPLAALEGLVQAPAKAIRDGVQQLNIQAQGSGLPKLPDVPQLPRIFSR